MSVLASVRPTSQSTASFWSGRTPRGRRSVRRAALGGPPLPRGLQALGRIVPGRPLRGGRRLQRLAEGPLLGEPVPRLARLPAGLLFLRPRSPPPLPRLRPRRFEAGL